MTINHLTNCQGHQWFWKERDLDSAEVPICLSSCLKTISISEFKGREPEMEVARYLLKHGRVLETMIIKTDANSKKKLSHKLSRCEKGSKTCQIEFTTN